MSTVIVIRFEGDRWWHIAHALPPQNPPTTQCGQGGEGWFPPLQVPLKVFRRSINACEKCLEELQWEAKHSVLP